MFKRTDSLITGKNCESIEATIVEFNDIFARHRLYNSMNTQFNVSLTPKDDKPVYTQSVPVPMKLKEDLTVKLALMHRYGIITTLPFFKYASPVFAQRKPSGKLSYLVEPSEEKPVLQTRLLPSLPLPSNGRPKVSRTPCI